MQSIERKVFQYPTLPKATLETIDSNLQLDIRTVIAKNRSGGALDVGILKKLNSQVDIKVYQKVLAVYTDITSSLLAGSDVTVFSNNDDALIFGSLYPFNYIGVQVKTDETVAGTYTLQYYDGSSLQTLAPIRVIADFAVGIDYILFALPLDWGKGIGVAGIDSSYYYVKFASTAKPTTAPVINGSWLAQLLAFQEAVADNGNLEITFGVDEQPYVLNQGEGIMPYFSAANAANIAEMTFIRKQ